ncbi:hypothetical protein ABGM23_001329 [Escherichia albertii]|uniref:hypothetical protein n=1 Tax=Escherichia albertii TaxID=208962 RepID=UPI000ADA6AE1|nr:hypothetical protein [Escherichia albertii]EJY9799329.1 hypothetical protein [Escherichia albertii]WDB73554.1 hypothetical protein PS034_19135 [Escherichia albertii]
MPRISNGRAIESSIRPALSGFIDLNVFALTHYLQQIHLAAGKITLRIGQSGIYHQSQAAILIVFYS